MPPADADPTKKKEEKKLCLATRKHGWRKSRIGRRAWPASFACAAIPAIPEKGFGRNLAADTRGGVRGGGRRGNTKLHFRALTNLRLTDSMDHLSTNGSFLFILILGRFFRGPL